MEPLSIFLTTALGYILKGAAKSKAATAAKEDLLSRFWQWIRPRILNKVPEAETSPGAPETEAKLISTLLELIEDETFFQKLLEKVTALQQAGIKAKNIVHGDIKRAKSIKIGDKEYSSDEPYTQKNIIAGNVEDADSFILGDGH